MEGGERDPSSSLFPWLPSSPHPQQQHQNRGIRSWVLVLLFSIAVLLFLPPYLASSLRGIRAGGLLKNGWDALNFLLVISAILCGLLSRGHSDEPLTPSKPSPPGPLNSTQWSESDDVPAPSAEDRAVPIRRMRSSSSYPDLRQEWGWDAADHYAWRFSDDIQLYRNHHRRSAGGYQTPLNSLDAEIKTIPVDTYVLRRSPSPPPTSPPATPPPPPPPPPPAAARPRRRTAQKPSRREEVKPDLDIQKQPPATPPPPPPPPPPTPPREVKPGHRRKKSVGGAKDIATALAQFYQKKRKKGSSSSSKKAHELNEDVVPSSDRSPASPSPPAPPPPPPPPPSSVFNKLFSKGGGSKSKRIHSFAPPAPPPPPPPPAQRRRKQASQMPPRPPSPPYIAPRRGHRSSSIGGYTNPPSFVMRAPPRPPPEEEEEEKTVGGGTEEAPTPVSCPSPDVNNKADMFIARFKAGLQLEKNNSIRERNHHPDQQAGAAAGDGEFMMIGGLFD